MNNPQINEDLTPQTAPEFKLEWQKDIPLAEYGVNKTNRDQYFGHPKNKDKNYLGIYKKMWVLPVDYTLTPNNAVERGYEWVADVYYHPEAPELANKEALEAYRKGCLFGEAASIAIMKNGFVGKYRAIK